jgi:hypothetical protein
MFSGKFARLCPPFEFRDRFGGDVLTAGDVHGRNHPRLTPTPACNWVAAKRLEEAKD